MTRLPHLALALGLLGAAMPADGERFLLVADSDADRVVAINPFSGVRMEVSGPGRGEGTPLMDLVGVAFDPEDEEHLWVTCRNFPDEPALVRIEWGTGDREEFSGEDEGDGPPLDDPRQVVIIDDGRLAVVADDDVERLIAIHLRDGSGFDPGDRFFWDTSGALLRRPNALAAEHDEDLLVNFRGDFSQWPDLEARLQRVDFETGFTTNFVFFATDGDYETETGPVGIAVEPSGDILTAHQEFPAILRLFNDSGHFDGFEVLSAGDNFDGDRAGSGPNFDTLADLTFFEGPGAGDDRVYAIDRAIAAVFEVDPRDGDRVILSDNGDEGPPLVTPRSICLGRVVPAVTPDQVARHLTGQFPLTSQQQAQADIDDDGDVDIADLVFLVNLGL